MSPHFPIGVYAIPEISMVGATEEELTRDKVPYETGIARFREIARGQILGDDSGLFKTIFRRDDGRLLGAHCIGTQATELIHIGQAVLALGGGLDYFLKTVFNYRPSPSATRSRRSARPKSCSTRARPRSPSLLPSSAVRA
jgi:NAD(P) transhydrogenase